MTLCKAPEDRRSAQICLLTVESHCQSTCKVCVQCQSSISCGAELLTARHLMCASKYLLAVKFALLFSKTPHVCCLPKPNQCCYQLLPRVSHGKGCPKRNIFLARFASAQNKVLNCQQARVAALGVPDRIPKSHC